jgi:hypothetical protein
MQDKDHAKNIHQVSIGNITLGENPADQANQPMAQANPVKITWSRTNSVKIHEVPYPKHKTMRTSKVSLYKLDIDIHAVKEDISDKLLKMCEDVGPVWVDTVKKQMWMYIVDYNFSQPEAKDDIMIDWSLSMQEVND